MRLIILPVAYVGLAKPTVWICQSKPSGREVLFLVKALCIIHINLTNKNP